MKTFTIAVSFLALLPALSLAASANQARQSNEISVYFGGATGNPTEYFTQLIPTDGTVVEIANPMSVSYIQAEGRNVCFFYGIDGSVTEVGPDTTPVGPPQTQVSGSCTYRG